MPYYIAEIWAGFPGNETPHIFQIIRSFDSKVIEEFQDKYAAYKELNLLNEAFYAGKIV